MGQLAPISKMSLTRTGIDVKTFRRPVRSAFLPKRSLAGRGKIPLGESHHRWPQPAGPQRGRLFLPQYHAPARVVKDPARIPPLNQYNTMAGDVKLYFWSVIRPGWMFYLSGRLVLWSSITPQHRWGSHPPRGACGPILRSSRVTLSP